MMLCVKYSSSSWMKGIQFFSLTNLQQCRATQQDKVQWQPHQRALHNLQLKRWEQHGEHPASFCAVLC
jgi:hypothetical protein